MPHQPQQLRAIRAVPQVDVAIIAPPTTRVPSGLHPTPYTRQMKGLPSRFPYAHFPPLAASGPVLPAAADATDQIASKVSVKTLSRISAPARVASCSSTPCRYAPTMESQHI